MTCEGPAAQLRLSARMHGLHFPRGRLGQVFQQIIFVRLSLQISLMIAFDSSKHFMALAASGFSLNFPSLGILDIMFRSWSMNPATIGQRCLRTHLLQDFVRSRS